MRLKEGRALEFRVQAVNAGLTLNFTRGANTNADFGTMTTATGQSHHLAPGVRFHV